MATSDSPHVGIYTDRSLGRDTTMHIDSGSVVNVDGALNLTSGQFTAPGSLSIGYLNLGPALFSARNAASGETVASGSSAPTAFFGGLLMPDGAPAMKMNSTIDHVWMLEWVSANVATIKTLPVALPNDFSTAGGLTIELFGEVVGTATAADAKQSVDILARFGVGNTSAAPVSHPNFTTTPSWKGITVASGSVTTDSLTIGLTPGTHAARAIRVFDMRASYTKKTS